MARNEAGFRRKRPDHQQRAADDAFRRQKRAVYPDDGQTGVKMYIGAMLSGSISGVVYYDDDADAKLGANETYCRGATVELLSNAGEVVASAQTAEGRQLCF